MPIGDSLRRARTERGLGLDQASDATKIRVRYLRALEAEDWGALPAPAYARGFLRTYASYLGLDADALVEEFRRTVPEPAAEPGRPEQREPVGPPVGGAAWPSWRLVAAAGAVVAILAVLFALGQNGGSGGGGKDSASKAGAGKKHHKQHHQAPKPPPAPTTASLELRPTGTIWVCLVDLSGKRLVDGQILSAGDTQGPFKAAGFELGLGNGEASITVNGKPVAVPSSPNPLAFHIGPKSAKAISPSKRPTCA